MTATSLYRFHVLTQPVSLKPLGDKYGTCILECIPQRIRYSTHTVHTSLPRLRCVVQEHLLRQLEDTAGNVCIKTMMNFILHNNGGFNYRGKPFSHDVDLLLTHPDRAVTDCLLHTLLAHLQSLVC